MAEVKSEETGNKKYQSAHGPFEIFANPPMARPITSEAMQNANVADGFEYSALAEKFGEQPVREKISELMQSYGNGLAVTPLFSQDGPEGMSLFHIWFGANLPLYRHSHPALGDCLYYVVSGQLILGKRRLGPGSVFFVPKDMPYKYSAGPDGVEVLEFRAGGGKAGMPSVKLEEQSLDSMQRIIDVARKQQPKWVAPEKIGDHAKAQSRVSDEAESR